MAICASTQTQGTQDRTACSGKCRSNCASQTPCVWVLAAAQGRVSLFHHSSMGLIPKLYHGNPVFPSLDEFCLTIRDAVEREVVDQLILVGSASDIAWLHMALPKQAARHVVAEIEGILEPSLFTAQMHASALSDAVLPLLAP